MIQPPTRYGNWNARNVELYNQCHENPYREKYLQAIKKHMTRNQEIINKLEHGGKDTLTDENVRYIQECFEVSEEVEGYPDMSLYVGIAFASIVTVMFIVGIGVGAVVF
ncbi:TPA: hypothetical protein DEP58_01740 [Patescibacteria group bacterium]|nr:hypothetical protein [Patescibacteria group bacterium]